MSFGRFSNLWKGEKAILVAGGPSLNDIPVDILNRELTFSVSLVYKLEHFTPYYHFIGDKNIAIQHLDEIEELRIAGLFVSNGIRKLFTNPKSPIYAFRGHPKVEFCKNPYNGVHGGGTSTFLAMQFAYFMGIQELYCVGLDHYEKLDEQLKQVNETGIAQAGFPLVETKGEDINHFTKDYYPEGTKWFIPQVERMAKSYQMAREVYEEAGRKIYNASTRTVLDEKYLPKIDFNEVTWEN